MYYHTIIEFLIIELEKSLDELQDLKKANKAYNEARNDRVIPNNTARAMNSNLRCKSEIIGGKLETIGNQLSTTMFREN